MLSPFPDRDVRVAVAVDPLPADPVFPQRILADVDPTPPSTGHIIALPISQAHPDDNADQEPAADVRVAVPALPKRRRIVGKTSSADPVIQAHYPRPAGPEPPEASCQHVAAPADPGGVAERDRSWAFPTEESWLDSPDRWKYNWLYDKIRSYFITSLPVAADAEDGDGQNAGRARYRHGKHLWGQLSLARKDEWAREWAMAFTAPAYVAERATSIFHGTSKSACADKMSRQVLLTYSGPWVLRDGDGNPCDRSNVSVDAVVSEIRDAETWQRSWNLFLQFCEEIKTQYGALEFAACMELCCSTLADQGLVRIHFHVFIRTDKPLTKVAQEALSYQSVRPCNSNKIAGVPSRKRNDWAGYFYCVVQKTGCIFVHGARRPFRDFSVRSDWIMNLLQCGKISNDYARELLGQTIAGCPRHLKEIEMSQQISEELHVRQVLAEAEAALASERRAWRVLPEVTEWQAQYDSHGFRF